MTKKKLTPLMQQYHEIKEKLPDALLFFQVGDFYELFFEDAKIASAFLGITLTARGKNKGEPIPLCGVPVHALDHYLNKLIQGGFKVAICDQLEPPKPGSVVKRGVTRVLTPGTLTDPKHLDHKSASYLCSFFPTKDACGLLFGELLTGQLFGTTIPKAEERVIESELIRFFPDEVVLPPKVGGKFQSFFKRLGYVTTPVECDTSAIESEVHDWRSHQFSKQINQSLEQQQALNLALYYFYAYVKRNQLSGLSQFRSMHLYKPEDFLILDPATQRNLELIHNLQDRRRSNTLFSVLDNAATPMGSRMIKKWLLRPLVKQEPIEQRLDVIHIMINHIDFMQQLEDCFAQVGDIERIIGRIGLKRAAVLDYLGLRDALKVIPHIKTLITTYDTALLNIIGLHLSDFSELENLLNVSINDDSSKDWIVKPGYDQTLDSLRELVEHSSEKILALEQQEQRNTGIQSLKIRYNQVHGYYIEVTKANSKHVPEYYVRQQTLVNRERFITPELQKLQGEIVRAKSEIDQVEKRVYDRIKQNVMSYITSLRKLSHALAHLDGLLGLATVSYNNGYVRPSFTSNRDILIKEGRHPVVEANLDEGFIPNDTQLTDQQSLWIITGPNMGGKSTYLRQVALISIMAQCGSFVPAGVAQLSLVDRIFTRIGAGDNVAQGKSTFLVEMEETATICSQATERSLVILDEVGRGTSTFDGLAIAQAVVEFLFKEIRARCLFATHYHELTHLEQEFDGIKSYYADSRKTPNGIVFRYKIVQGVADGSFGVEVAKLAHLPHSVVTRAQALLDYFTVHGHHGMHESDNKSLITSYERLLEEHTIVKKEFSRVSSMLKMLQGIEYDNLSPKGAFDLLWKFKEQNNTN